MKKNYFFALATAVIILTSCTSAAAGTTTSVPDDTLDNPVSSDDPTPPAQSENYLPSPADSNLRREDINLESTEMLTLESYPVQYTLVLRGTMPTPCNQLRIASSPYDEQNKISMDVYSVVDPNVACAEMLQLYEVNFPLGSFPAGHYTIWINGKQVAEFDA